MGRYIFFNNDCQDSKALMAARRVARSHGATVVKSVAGTLLLELSPAQVPQVAEALPGWRYTVERQVTRLPERKPLQRARSAAASSPARKT
jgi:hypothetical protein